MANLLLVICLALSLTACVYTQNTQIFNCQRVGDQDCAADTCNLVSGQCNCVSPNTNFDCGTQATGTSCNPACSTGAFCHSDNTCHCPEDSYHGSGSQCEHKRLGHVCTVDTKFIMNVNLVGTYTARVNGLAGCEFATAGSPTVPTDWQGVWREVDLPTDANCGTATTTTNPDGSAKTCIDVEVRYNDNYWTSLDSLVTFCCEGTKVVDVVIGNLAPPAGLPSGTTVVPPAGTSASLVPVLKSGGNALTNGAPIDIGDELTIEVALAANSGFSAVKILDCKAQDDSATPTITQPFVTTGCPSTTFVSSVALDSVVTTAIKFVDLPNVYYYCDVLLCRQSSNCVLETCTSKRKRRSAEQFNNSTEVGTFVAYVKVNSPNDNNGAKELDSKVEAAVEKQTSINLSAAVIGLAVVVLVLLSVCLLLGVCLISKSRMIPNSKA